MKKVSAAFTTSFVGGLLLGGIPNVGAQTGTITVPFEGVDALSAARQAALNNLRPAFAPLSPSASNKETREVRSRVADVSQPLVVPFLRGWYLFFIVEGRKHIVKQPLVRYTN